MVKRRIMLAGLVALAVAGCSAGGPGTGPAADVLPIIGGKSHNLLLFSAPWCENCNLELAEVNSAFQGNSQLQKGVSVTVYVEEGPIHQPPTSSMALEYGHNLHLNLTVLPDPWRWSIYEHYYPQGYNLPGAVVLDSKGNTERIFSGSYGASDVVTYLEGLLNDNFMR